MEYTLSKRNKTWIYYKDIFTNFYNKDVEDFRTFFNKKKTLGEGSQGKVYEYQLKRFNNNYPTIAVKKFYVDEEESEYIDNPLNEKALELSNYVEPAASILINLLLLQNICPHFIFYYTTNYVERDGICDDLYPYYGFHYNEYISSSETFEDWITNTHLIMTWYNAYFQIMVAIYSLKKYFNMNHFDLHPGNILVKKIPKGGYWSYIINNKTYNLPNLGYLFFIVDFGYAFIPNTFRSWVDDECKYTSTYHIDKINLNDITDDFDIRRLFNETLHLSTSSTLFNNEIENIVKQLISKSFITIFENIFLKKYNNIYLDKPIEYYNLDKNIKKDKNVPKKLRRLINKCN